MADCAILKMIISLHLRRYTFDFDEIWYDDANFESENDHVTKKIKISQIQDCGRTPLLNIVFRLYLSAILSD